MKIKRKYVITIGNFACLVNSSNRARPVKYLLSIAIICIGSIPFLRRLSKTFKALDLFFYQLHFVNQKWCILLEM